MIRVKKILLTLSLLVAFGGCVTDSIFQPTPLTLSPLILVNPIALALDPAAERLYLVNSNNTVLFADSTFVILNIANPVIPTPVAVISIPSFSGQIQLDTARGFVYLPNRLSPGETLQSDAIDQVLRININEASPDFLKIDSFESAPNPFGGFYDGTDTLFVTCTDDALRYDVDSFTGFTQVDLDVTTAQGRLIDSSLTRESSLSPSGDWLFVTNETDSMLILNAQEFIPPTVPGPSLLITEPVDYIVTGTVSTLGAGRDSNYVYVLDGAPPLLRILSEDGLTPVSGSPQEISISSLQVASIPVGTQPGEILIDDVTQRAYVANTGSDDVSVIDTNLQLEIDRIPLDEDFPEGVAFGDAPFALALGNIGGVNYLYVANFESNNLTIINADTLTVLASFP